MSDNGEITITSPLPGTILDVLVTPGQSVAEDETLLILEAMKMENEIVATQAGEIVSVAVAKGDAVDTDAVLVVLR